MQELFSQLEMEHPNLFNTNTLEGRKFINDYYKFFEMEKQQIIDAYLKDRPKATIDKVLVSWDNAEDYYNQKFNTNDN